MTMYSSYVLRVQMAILVSLLYGGGGEVWKPQGNWYIRLTTTLWIEVCIRNSSCHRSLSQWRYVSDKINNCKINKCMLRWCHFVSLFARSFMKLCEVVRSCAKLCDVV